MHLPYSIIFSIVILLCTVFGEVFAASDDQITLHCTEFSNQLAAQLENENLTRSAPEQEGQIRALAFNACERAEASAQEQHTNLKTKAMDRWFFDYHADKAGNRRLKNKR